MKLLNPPHPWYIKVVPLDLLFSADVIFESRQDQWTDEMRLGDLPYAEIPVSEAKWQYREWAFPPDPDAPIGEWFAYARMFKDETRPLILFIVTKHRKEVAFTP